MRAEKQADFIDYCLLNIHSLFLFAEFNLGRIGHFTGHNIRAADAPSALCVFTAHQMPAAGSFASDLAGSSNLDSFAQSLMALLFRHLTISLNRIYQISSIEKAVYCLSFRY